MREFAKNLRIKCDKQFKFLSYLTGDLQRITVHARMSEWCAECTLPDLPVLLGMGFRQGVCYEEFAFARMSGAFQLVT